jgi:hypothetical protein
MLQKNVSRYTPTADGFEAYNKQAVLARGVSSSKQASSSSKVSSANQDHMSLLFGSISSICTQQFEVISEVKRKYFRIVEKNSTKFIVFSIKIFPKESGIRVMRLLIQRIFNDPAFGVQAHIEHALYPPAPHPRLQLGEFLNVLANVREKLEAFHLILSDYCQKFGLLNDRSQSETIDANGNTNLGKIPTTAKFEVFNTTKSNGVSNGLPTFSNRDGSSSSDLEAEKENEAKIFLKNQV